MNVQKYTVVEHDFQRRPFTLISKPFFKLKSKAIQAAPVVFLMIQIVHLHK